MQPYLIAKIKKFSETFHYPKMDPNYEYYCNVIDKGRNEIQIFETGDFTLINSIELNEDQVVKKVVWTPAPEGDEGDEKYHLVCLLAQALLVVSPMVGIIDLYPLDLDHELNDICYSGDQIWGCFDEGIIEIRLTQKKTMKPIKSKEVLKSVVSEKEGVLVLSATGKVYKVSKRLIKEHNMNPEMKHIEFIHSSGDEVIVGNKDGILIHNEHLSIPEVIGYRNINDTDFIFTKSSVHIKSKSNQSQIELNGNSLIDVCPGTSWRFIYKQGNTIQTVTSDLRSKTIDLESNGHSANDNDNEIEGEEDELNGLLDRENKLLADQLVPQLINHIEDESKSQVTALCETICNETTIKTSILQLTSSHQSFLLDCLVSKISKNSLDSFNLSIWLKWVLISNPQILTTLKPKKAKALHANLLASLKYYPNLLSIKGKLSLLKSQQDLKQKLAQLNAQDDEPLEREEDETMNMSASFMTTNGDITEDHDQSDVKDDSVFIANGENDEDDSLVETQAQDDVEDDEEY